MSEAERDLQALVERLAGVVERALPHLRTLHEVQFEGPGKDALNALIADATAVVALARSR